MYQSLVTCVKKTKTRLSDLSRFFPIIIGVMIVCVVLVIKHVYNPPATKDIVVQRSESIMSRCIDDDRSREKCYSKEITKLLSVESMDVVTDIVKYIQAKDQAFTSCHALGHSIGEKLLELHDNDWIEALISCPADMCSYGCGHGAMQSYFRSDSLSKNQVDEVIPVLASACQENDRWSPTDRENRYCLHSMGHLAFFITQGDVHEGIDVCRRISELGRGKRDFDICAGGVFMVLYFPADSQEAALTVGQAPTKDTLKEFCEQFEEDTSRLCLEESWSLFVDEVQNAKGVETYCEMFERFGRESACIHRMGAELLMVNKMQYESVLDVCTSLESNQDECVAGIATQLFSVDVELLDQSFEVCAFAEDIGIGELCHERLIDVAASKFGTETREYASFCQQIDSQYEKICTSYTFE